eukprot:TRINITY_DN47811_c0_g1_i1.p1 TRINITY_DN47811_c0_g1~~TRINITY_DN47811_c0_g1_i1.p1  ORF type:complete len:213 (+),score=33.07 TRINITY_DN47811_c0_g1_i1:62-700(+)
MSSPFSEDDLEGPAERHFCLQLASRPWFQHRVVGLGLFCFALIAFVLLEKRTGRPVGHVGSAPFSEVVSYVALNTSSSASYEDVVHAVSDLQDHLSELQQRLAGIKAGMNMCGMEMCVSQVQCCHGKNCCAGGTQCCPAGNCCGADSVCCVTPGGFGHCCGKGGVCCQNGLCGEPGSTCKGDIVLAPNAFQVHIDEPKLMAEIRATEDVDKT